MQEMVARKVGRVGGRAWDMKTQKPGGGALGTETQTFRGGTAGSLTLIALSLQRGPVVWCPGCRKRECQLLALGSLRVYRKVGQVGETRSEFTGCW